jgi:LEA14-like dessication related protein
MRTATRFLSFLSLAALLALGAVSPACRALVREAFQPPKVRVIDVALVSNPLADPGKPWECILSLEVNNRNDYPLRVAYVAYSATLGRETVADGELRDDIRIDASGLTVVPVPLSIRPDPMEEAVRQVLSGRTVTYEFNGSVGLRTPVFGIVRIPFSKTGGFDPLQVLKQKGFGVN